MALMFPIVRSTESPMAQVISLGWAIGDKRLADS